MFMVPIIINMGNAYLSRQLQDTSSTGHRPSAYPATPLWVDFLCASEGQRKRKKKEGKEEVEKEKEQEGLERVQEEWG